MNDRMVRLVAVCWLSWLTSGCGNGLASAPDDGSDAQGERREANAGGHATTDDAARDDAARDDNDSAESDAVATTGSVAEEDANSTPEAQGVAGREAEAAAVDETGAGVDGKASGSNSGGAELDTGAAGEGAVTDVRPAENGDQSPTVPAADDPMPAPLDTCVGQFDCWGPSLLGAADEDVELGTFSLHGLADGCHLGDVRLNADGSVDEGGHVTQWVNEADTLRFCADSTCVVCEPIPESTYPACTGSPRSCSSLSAGDCVSDGCSFVVGVDAFGQPTSDCVGTARSCDRYDSAGTCELQTGCEWQEGPSPQDELEPGKGLLEALPGFDGSVGKSLLQNVRAIYARGLTTCAIDQDDAVHCWGRRLQADGSHESVTSATGVRSLQGARQLVMTGTDVCGLTVQGHVDCLEPGWDAASAVVDLAEVRAFAGGRGVCALLDNGGSRCVTPGDPDAGSNYFTAGIRLMAYGSDHECLVTTSGVLACAGENDDGQLGNGSYAFGDGLVEVSMSGEIVQVDAYGNTTCVVVGNGQVSCWGSNDDGMLAQPTATDDSPLPVPVQGLDGVVQLAMDTHVCAVDSSGSVFCWGDNYFGQIQAGAESVVGLTQIPGLENVAQVAVGWEHTCALLRDGTVSCWGSNDFGQLGDGTTVARTEPGPVWNSTEAMGGPPSVRAALVPANDFRQIRAGAVHTCGLRATGEVLCWGARDDEVLGNDDRQDSPRAVPVQGLGATVQQIALGSEHSCALMADQTTACWGTGRAGTLERGEWGVPESSITLLDASEGRQCEAVGSIVNCWGESGFPDEFLSNSTPTQLATGADHVCLLNADGSVACAGFNDRGQLGTGDADGYWYEEPFEVLPPGGAVAVAARRDSTCAVKANGRVSCWGDNEWWLFSQGTEQPASGTPTEIPALSGVSSVSLGRYHACAVNDDGSVWCWGDNEKGQVGVDPLSQTFVQSPSPVAGIDDAIQVAVGDAHTCALRSNGEAMCWGANDRGTLGNGNMNDHYVPVQVVE